MKILSGVEELATTLVTVESRKYDGRLGRSWRARLLRQQGPLIVLDGTFEEEISHDFLGTISGGTRSIEFYWRDRWFSVFRFHEPSGELRNFYCNVNTPVAFDGSLLSYTDLDIDILVMPDFTYKILDEDEFEENVVRLSYPEEVRAEALAALEQLRTLIERREFPFNDSLQ